MRHWLVLTLALCLLYAPPALATRERIQGWCQDGGVAVAVPGTAGSGTQRFQQSYRSCTVTVYQAGTTTLATLYADAAGTAQANPFTATALGRWFFYADGGLYDVRFSAGGVPTPFTLGDFRSGNVVLDVLDYGAKGDWNGTAGTDDTTAIQRAINALPTRGGYVYFPLASFGTGRYRVTATLTVPASRRVVLVGVAGDVDGNGGSRIDCRMTNSTDCISAIGGGSIISLEIRNLVIAGNGSARDGIRVDTGLDGRVTTDNIRVIDFTAGNGLYIGAISNTRCINSVFKGNAIGVEIVGAGSAHNFFACDMVGNSTTNLRTGSGGTVIGNVTLFGGDFTLATDAVNLTLNRCARCVLHGIFLESTVATRNSAMISISGASGTESTGVSIINATVNGNSMTGGTGVGILINWGLNVTMDGVSVSSGTGAPLDIQSNARNVRIMNSVITGTPTVNASARPTFTYLDASNRLWLGSWSTSTPQPGVNAVVIATSTSGMIADFDPGTNGNVMYSPGAVQTGSLTATSTYDFPWSVATLNAEVQVNINNTRATCLFYLRGDVNATQEVADPTGACSTTQGTGSSTNVYYVAGPPAAYRLENNNGATRTFTLKFKIFN